MILPSFNFYGRSFFFAFGFVFTTEILWKAYLKYRNNAIDYYKNKTKTEIFFFSENGSTCQKHLKAHSPCRKKDCPVFYLLKIKSHLLKAKKSIDICVYFLTFSSIVEEIIKMKRRNVFIRIITDESLKNDNKQIIILRKEGIKIAAKRSLYLMHHKFAVIDKTILITGSANWTLQAFFGNCENLIITNQSDLVQAYSAEFEKLWISLNSS